MLLQSFGQHYGFFVLSTHSVLRDLNAIYKCSQGPSKLSYGSTSFHKSRI